VKVDIAFLRRIYWFIASAATNTIDSVPTRVEVTGTLSKR